MTQIREVNPMLIDMAAWRLQNEAEKQAFVPAGADPAAAGGAPPPGAPPMDPAAAGGGAPPMDPAAGGGAPPPMDPMAAGGGGGAPPMMDPAMQAMITQVVQAVMQQMGGAGGAGGAGAGPAGPGKGSAKVDPGLIYMELGRVRKLLTGMYQNLDWELPPDILDDSAVAQSVAGADPTGQPLPPGGAPPAADPAAAAGGAPPPGLPGIGQSAPISPIEPAGAEAKAAAAIRSTANDDVLRMLGLAGESGGSQIAASTFDNANRRAEAIAALSRSVNGAGVA